MLSPVLAGAIRGMRETYTFVRGSIQEGRPGRGAGEASWRKGRLIQGLADGKELAKFTDKLKSSSSGRNRQGQGLERKKGMVLLRSRVWRSINDEKSKRKKTQWFPTAGKSSSEPVVFAEFGSKDAASLHPRVRLVACHSVGGGVVGWELPKGSQGHLSPPLVSPFVPPPTADSAHLGWLPLCLTPA